MATTFYNRYRLFINDEQIKSVPFIKLPEKGTDKFTIYQISKSRLDKISQEFYSSPEYGFLIQLANPEYGGSESNIPNQASLRVPYPLIDSLRDYENQIKRIQIFYGE